MRAARSRELVGDAVLTDGGRGITFLLSAILFRIVPTALEISLVCGILVRVFTSPTRGSVAHPPCYTDVQLWVELCGNHGWHDGRLYLVHCTDYFMEVCSTHEIARFGCYS